MPYWVGGGKPLSDGAVQYHIDYLKGALKMHNITFDYMGIWNEAPWTKEYCVCDIPRDQLRHAARYPTTTITTHTHGHQHNTATAAVTDIATKHAHV